MGFIMKNTRIVNLSKKITLSLLLLLPAGFVHAMVPSMDPEYDRRPCTSEYLLDEGDEIIKELQAQIIAGMDSFPQHVKERLLKAHQQRYDAVLLEGVGAVHRTGGDIDYGYVRRRVEVWKVLLSEVMRVNEERRGGELEANSGCLKMLEGLEERDEEDEAAKAEFKRLNAQIADNLNIVFSQEEKHKYLSDCTAQFVDRKRIDPENFGVREKLELWREWLADTEERKKELFYRLKDEDPARLMELQRVAAEEEIDKMDMEAREEIGALPQRLSSVMIKKLTDDQALLVKRAETDLCWAVVHFHKERVDIWVKFLASIKEKKRELLELEEALKGAGLSYDCVVNMFMPEKGLSESVHDICDQCGRVGLDYRLIPGCAWEIYTCCDECYEDLEKLGESESAESDENE